MICHEDALCTELAKREERAAHLQYFAQARVLGVMLGRHVTVARMLQNANQTARLIGALHYVFVVAHLFAFVAMPGYFARDSVGPLQVLGRLGRKGA